MLGGGPAARCALSQGPSAEQQIAAIEARLGGRLGVAALATGSSRRIEHRANERFLLCSTFKLIAAAAVLHRVDEKQEEAGRFISYTAADLLEYAPITKQYVQEGGMKLIDLCAAAVSYSDNTAGNLLLKAIDGPGGFTRYARSLGDEKTRLDRVEPELNRAAPGDVRDTTTPAAMLGNLRALLLGEALSAASREQLEAWMLGNTTGKEMIRAGVPRDWKVGDKTGRGDDNAMNDVAILRPPGKPPILLAIYSAGSTAPTEDRLAAMAKVARIIAEAFVK
ncbi:MAG: class A beta-lactamase [Verrucomicrobiota bacterium]|nr:class A beta-lactamase [Verrucomicrobiota bacterium]